MENGTSQTELQRIFFSFSRLHVEFVHNQFCWTSLGQKLGWRQPTFENSNESFMA